MSKETTFQITLSSRWVWAGIVPALALVVLVIMEITSSTSFFGILRSLSLVLAVSYFFWWYWVWPRVVLTNAGIAIRNMYRQTFVPWENFDKAESHLGLYIWKRGTPEGDSHRLFASAVHAKGAIRVPTGASAGASPRIDFSTSSQQRFRPDPQAAVAIIEQCQLHSQPDSSRPFSSRWNWYPLIGQLLLIALTVALFVR